MTLPMPEHFSELPLSPVMQRALAKIGWTKPSPIQAGVIPHALEGYDILGQARTGTGKTASFAIPILEQLDPLRVNPLPQALVLIPTRELANQVHGEFVKLAEGCPTEVVEVAGGKHMQKQLKALAKGVQIVVGTPGRVIDHIQRGSLRLDGLWCVVLDEADRMLDIGFRPSIERILRRCPQNRQTMLLSATLDERIRDLANRYLYEPIVVDCSDKDVSVETIEQRFISVSPDRKQEVLLQLLDREQPPQAIIFCRTKIGTAKLHRQLERFYAGKTDCKVRVGTIHGDMSQPQRDEVFKALRENKIDILVATDVVGRGIDVSSISHIINYDLPDECDDYVHRVGRTGRMGRSGIAFSFVSKDQGYLLTDIEQRINRMLEKDPLSEVVGKRRVPTEASSKQEVRTRAAIAHDPSTNDISAHGDLARGDLVQGDSSQVAIGAESPKVPEEDLPFGTAPARRTAGRAKSRGSMRRR